MYGSRRALLPFVQYLNRHRCQNVVTPAFGTFEVEIRPHNIAIRISGANFHKAVINRTLHRVNVGHIAIMTA